MTMLSVVIPVYRERGIIRDAVERIVNRADYTPASIEIIVVDGEKDGKTIEFLDKYDDHNIIRIISEKGRGVQMNAGAAAAKGSILLFLHADSILPDNALNKVLNIIGMGADFGAFSLSIDSPHFFFRFLEWAAGIRCRISGIPYGDQAFFIRKDVFNESGGYASIPIMEDVEFVKRLKKSRRKIAILKERVLTSARRWHEDGYIKTLFINRLVSLLYSFGVSTERLAVMRAGQGRNGVIVFVRYPESGRVKTRIGKVLGHEFTLGLYRGFVDDIIKKSLRQKADLLIYFTPDSSAQGMRNWLGLDISIFPQIGYDIGERMKNAFAEQFSRGYKRLVLIGSDIPQIPAGRLRKSLALLRRNGAVIGPSEDGGYYLIGFDSEKFTPGVFRNIPWSTSSVLSLTTGILSKKGIKTALLKKMSDIDTADDLKRVLNSGRMPATRSFINRWTEDRGGKNAWI